MVAYLVVVSHDSTFELRLVDPCHKVLHVPGGGMISMYSVGKRRAGSPSDEVSRVCDGVWADSDVPLFDELHRLADKQCDQQHVHMLAIPPRRTALTVSAILAMVMITASRRRQNAATVSLFSTSLSLACEVSTPMS